MCSTLQQGWDLAVHLQPSSWLFFGPLMDNPNFQVVLQEFNRSHIPIFLLDLVLPRHIQIATSRTFCFQRCSSLVSLCQSWSWCCLSLIQTKEKIREGEQKQKITLFCFASISPGTHSALCQINLHRNPLLICLLNLFGAYLAGRLL